MDRCLVKGVGLVRVSSEVTVSVDRNALKCNLKCMTMASLQTTIA